MSACACRGTFDDFESLRRRKGYTTSLVSPTVRPWPVLVVRRLVDFEVCCTGKCPPAPCMVTAIRLGRIPVSRSVEPEIGLALIDQAALLTTEAILGLRRRVLLRHVQVRVIATVRVVAVCRDGGDVTPGRWRRRWRSWRRLYPRFRRFWRYELCRRPWVRARAVQEEMSVQP